MSETTKIANLNISSRGVNVVGKIVAKSAERSVMSQFDQMEHRISESTLADETGAVTLVLWDDNIDKVNEGDVVEVGNGYIKVFRGSMQLNVGRYGTLEKSTETVDTVNTENNLSQREMPPQYGSYGRRYGGYRRGYRRDYGYGRRDRDRGRESGE